MIFVNEGPARLWAPESLSVVHTTSMFWLDNLSILWKFFLKNFLPWKSDWGGRSSRGYDSKNEYDFWEFPTKNTDQKRCQTLKKYSLKRLHIISHLIIIIIIIIITEREISNAREKSSLELFRERECRCAAEQQQLLFHFFLKYRFIARARV